MADQAWEIYLSCERSDYHAELVKMRDCCRQKGIRWTAEEFGRSEDEELSEIIDRMPIGFSWSTRKWDAFMAAVWSESDGGT